MHILAMGNKYAMVAIKTSERNTKRVSISNIITHGTVNSVFFFFYLYNGKICQPGLWR